MLFRANFLLAMIIQTTAGRFLFRREKKPDQNRVEAFDELFNVIQTIVETATLLKPGWTEAWEARTDADLPPKYRADQYLYPNAVPAAYDAKFTRALLYQNRWNSQIEPLFETYDPNAWTRVRATLERSSAALLGVREAHWNAFHAEEASWIDRAVEGIDEARYVLRNAERDDTPHHEIVASSTFQTLYSLLQLSESMLDGLRREAQDR
ncbi:MAG: hypothetical protein R2849_08390 [Thermomicrobiales bacterium]